jgi:hypothetical protein
MKEQYVDLWNKWSDVIAEHIYFDGIVKWASRDYSILHNRAHYSQEIT